MFAMELFVGLSTIVNDSSTDQSNSVPYQDCAKACGECALQCDICAAHCAKMLAEGHKDHLKTLQSCQDCATVCASAACIMARTGPYSMDICRACADVCKKCGDECAKFSSDATMKRCADECRQCEKACRDMLASATNR
jgi:hypothetical protein